MPKPSRRACLQILLVVCFTVSFYFLTPVTESLYPVLLLAGVWFVREGPLWPTRKLPVSSIHCTRPLSGTSVYPRRVFFALDEHVAVHDDAVPVLYRASWVARSTRVAWCRRAHDELAAAGDVLSVLDSL